MKQSKKILAVILSILITFSLVACSSNTNTTSDKFPMDITDDYGNTATLEKAPERIVSLSPSNTEILFAVGAGDKVVGKTTSCNYPEETSKIEGIVGDYMNVNIETIISLDPDLVIGEYLDEDSVNLLKNSNIAYYGVSYETIDKVFANIENIGKITGNSSEAKKVVDEMKKEKDELMDKVKDAENVRVFVDLGGFYSINDSTFMGEMLKCVGAENIVGDNENAYPQVSLETIIQKDPEIYISLGTPVETLKETAELNNTSAFKNNKVIFYDYGSTEQDILQRPGPRTVQGMELFAKIIHPELFK